MDKDDVVYISVFHTTEYYSAIKKNEIMPFVATWMDLDIIALSEVSQKDKYHVILLIYESKNKDTNELIYSTEIHSQI